ncbi:MULTISPECIES: protein phosphatase CheZ [Alteromonas]|jgi:chemotaxis protein CheZ|uniref:Protein phosphatase CheZ n=3 Tax=Alteromonas stellipolaris TaxID=233316 RepID=A0AAW7Z3K9_9ALTE|nr:MULTISPECIES: protein phosphatase CheZ [Alteromonas]AMJ90715.1 protein phosphatase [Alteromonas sp. Mac2]ALM91447.1 Chemotaxis response - phosphatase CheZ [Alteromonas stellipolaris LMG 21856]AMJ74423.1 protein phosphatase [Alteromonas stellipolaris]AMJ86856.1 protein phosphatase [Alteromonas sp. Mac1]AMJ94598.1 protein phosphatase [Alteromonas stellipolaris]|mmetsp:Transcript_11898/g.30567  ORF Transcript_11898/g.30567 Transcript_11898/m.30567 type:complete len:255 (-) Transcript_11898:5560-6324(-)
MSTNESVSITLEEAKKLVAYLEEGDNASANAVLEAVSMKESIELFAEVGKLTRQLHDSLNNFQIDERIKNLTVDDIPDAQTRLMYVIEETEKAANTTMDAVEECMPIAEVLSTRIEKIMPEWKKLMNRQLELGEFKVLCADLDELLEDGSKQSSKLTSLLTEVLMAQGYQDLTGQVIRRVIELVKEVEDSLVNMLTMFGEPEQSEQDKPSEAKVEKVNKIDGVEAEGPIIDADQRDDVVSGQDDVDDLLSSLGF